MIHVYSLAQNSNLRDSHMHRTSIVLDDEHIEMLREIEDKSILHGIASILRMSLGVFFDLFRGLLKGTLVLEPKKVLR
jgi:hypothetical protein